MLGGRGGYGSGLGGSGWLDWPRETGYPQTGGQNAAISSFGNATNIKSLTAKSDQKQWKCLAITWDCLAESYQNFLENNNHLQIETFQGIKGRDLLKEEIISQGLATSQLAWSPLLTNGAIGCAASHKAIWDKAAKGGNGYFILEDDCYTHPRVDNFINDNLTRVMNVDICFFGINTDSILQSISPTGLKSLSLFNPKHPTHEWIRNALSKTSAKEVAMHRLIKAFGYCAYFISPSGAKKLSTKIFPLSLSTTNIPLITEQMPAISIDRAGCSAYSHLKAFICQPFLAYTLNTDSTTKE